jgi:hypothetical protein
MLLFDLGPPPEPIPSISSDADEEEETLAEIGENQDRDDDPLDDAA